MSADGERACCWCGQYVMQGAGTYHGDLGVLSHDGVCEAQVHGLRRDFSRSRRGRRRRRRDVLADIARHSSACVPEHPGGFVAPREVVPPVQPIAFRMAAKKLYDYAQANNIGPEQPLLTMTLIGSEQEVAELEKAARAVRWFVAWLEGRV